ncbi:MAG: HD domain-containing protein [Gammaproteobacteria bacterium]|nr:HD domain-containing protein [Gammaproteobacteria bacterium]
MSKAEPQTPDEVIEFIKDIFTNRGGESYLGEPVSMSEHMLQAAYNAEKSGQEATVVVAALLHDIGHYTGEFGDDFMQLGIDNLHEVSGERFLKRWFPPQVTEPVRWHVDAKRYLCAVDPDYFATLTAASVRTLELQGDPMSPEEVSRFSANPWLDRILKVRRFDDQGKVPGTKTPNLDHYLPMVRQVIDECCDAGRD